MINIISVKWGTKYSSKEVNTLYRMVEKNLSLPFTFYCFTEDPTGLREEIQIIENTLEYNLQGVWNKLILFKKGVLPDGIKLFFDIDIVIQGNIDYLLDHLNPGLTKVKAFWKDPNIKCFNFDMQYNSSIMLWEDDLSHIWDYFIEDPDHFTWKYLGIDRFLYHEGFRASHFPAGTIYSRIHGKDLESFGKYQHLIERKPGWLEFAYYYPEYKICLFNGPVIEEHYKGFEKYLL